MSQLKKATFGPVALTATTSTSILVPGTTTGNTGCNTTITKLKFVITKIRIVNTSASPLTASLFVGAASANTAGTEFLGSALSVGANSYVEWVGQLVLTNGDTAAALCGGGSSTGLTFEAEGEVGVA